jgi:hypothetical protein
MGKNIDEIDSHCLDRMSEKAEGMEQIALREIVKAVKEETSDIAVSESFQRMSSQKVEKKVRFTTPTKAAGSTTQGMGNITSFSPELEILSDKSKSRRAGKKPPTPGKNQEQIGYEPPKKLPSLQQRKANSAQKPSNSSHFQ